MSYLKIGFHTGPGGNRNGIGDYWRELNAAGVPACQKAVDDYGPCYELAMISRASGVPHTIVFRLTTAGQNDGHDYDTPHYELEPSHAAKIHFGITIAKLPPEFDKELVWLEFINEPDQERSEWLAEFSYELAVIALDERYKSAHFGWASGTPHGGDWLEPEMIRFLTLAEDNPDMVAVALHEYSYDLDDILADYPYKVGRFEFLFAACDELSIAHPTVIMTEWGWGYRNVPQYLLQAIQDIETAADIYSEHPSILHSGLWYLGGGYGDIHNQAQALIAPTTELALIYEGPEPIPPDPPPVKHKAIVVKSPQELTKEEWSEMADYSFELRHTMTASSDDMLTIIGGGNAESYAKVFEVERPSQKEAIRFLNDAGYMWEPHSIYQQHPFKLTHWPTESQRITQEFAANPQNYSHYCDANGLCLPGHNGIDIEAPLGAPFYAAKDGLVIWDSDLSPSTGKPSDYGWHIRILHEDGTITIYAHADPNMTGVELGSVKGGDVIARSGNTGNSNWPHLHFEMRYCPGLPDWPWCIIDPTSYLEPLITPEPPSYGISMRPYLQVVESGPGPFFVVQHNTGITENIQMQVEGQLIYAVKNSSYEKMRFYQGFLERAEDTSHGRDTAYLLDDNGDGWSRWMPEVWSVGDVYWRSPDVIVFRKDNCEVISSSADVTSFIRFDGYYSGWVSPPSNASPSGVMLEDVIELSFGFSLTEEPVERYWFAKGVGYPVRWMNNTGSHSWISELPEGREPLVKDLVDCF